MTPNTQTDASERPTGFEQVGRLVDQHEQLITILAASLGVMIVAAIAVLMGMA